MKLALAPKQSDYTGLYTCTCTCTLGSGETSWNRQKIGAENLGERIWRKSPQHTIFGPITERANLSVLGAFFY